MINLNYVELNRQTYDIFTILGQNNNAIENIDVSEFDIIVDGPSNPTVTIFEVGHGTYRMEFTPDTVGPYIIIVSHPVYAPIERGGIRGIFECVEDISLIESIKDDTSNNIPGTIAAYHASTDNLIDVKHSATDALINTVDGKVSDILNDYKAYFIIPNSFNKGMVNRVVFGLYDGKGDIVVDVPQITIYDQIHQIIFGPSNMTAYGDGWYYYDFTPNEDDTWLEVMVTVNGKSWRSTALSTTDSNLLETIDTKVDKISSDTDSIINNLSTIDTNINDIEAAVETLAATNNKIIDNQVYVNNRLVSARVRVYEDNTLTNLLKTYNVEAQYDVRGDCIYYKMVEV